MKYNSQESNYLNPSFPNYFKHVEGELHKSKVVAMVSDLCNQQQQLNSSLTRYRSAPSSLLENPINGNGDGCDDFSMFATFMSCGGRNFVSSHLYDDGEKTSAPSQSSSPQFIAPNHRSADDVVIESSCRNIMAMDSEDVMKSSSNCSNLISHGSSHAGLFSHMDVQNGYVVMGGMGDVRGGNGINGGATASTSRFNNQMSPLPRPMSRISEMGTEIIGPSSPDNGNSGNSNGNLRAYISGELELPISSWEDSSLDNFTSLKGSHGTIISSLNASEAQNGNVGNQTSLIHQFSFPKTLSEMPAMEKILQFQDSLPCKIRAKRGCATHPRSIAERVRRTRISQRMRKLQELVPNMDRQTNTADMLDFAVDYIKDLQRQVKTLSDIRASCICLSKQKPYTDPVE